MTKKIEVPKFESEAEEASWWDAHREESARWMEEEVAGGETPSLSDVLRRARERAGRAPTVTIPLDPADAERARALAARKGVPYEAYVKSLLHEALDRDERGR